MFRVRRFKDRFALGLGIYCGNWGVNIYLDFWQWSLSYESKVAVKKAAVKKPCDI